MIKIYIHTLICGAIYIISLSTLLAQGTDFFPKNYTAEILQEKNKDLPISDRDASGKQKGQADLSRYKKQNAPQFDLGSSTEIEELTPQGNENENLGTAVDQDGEKTEPKEANPFTIDPAKVSKEAGGQAVPLQLIGAVLSGMAESEFILEFNKLLDISYQRKIPLGPVYVAGKLPITEPRIMMGLKFQGGWIEDIAAFPEEIKLTRSPSWLLYSNKGLIVLEGLDLDRFLDEAGRFKPPSKTTVITAQPG